MSDVTVSISSTPDLVTNVTIIEDDFPVQVGYDDNDIIPGPTGPAGEDGEQGPAGPPGPGSIQNLSDVLTEGNDGGGAQIKNIGTPTENQDAATKNYVDSNISTNIQGVQNALLNEANQRTTADAALQTQVSSLGITTGTHSTQILALQNADAAEASARADADTALLDQITTLDSWAKNNSGNTHAILIAGEALGEGSVCFMDVDTLAKKVDLTTTGLYNKSIGICKADTPLGAEVELYFSGFCLFTSNILTPGSLYYVSTTGQITSTPTRLVAGIAITETLFFVKIAELLDPIIPEDGRIADTSIDEQSRIKAGTILHESFTKNSYVYKGFGDKLDPVSYIFLGANAPVIPAEGTLTDLTSSEEELIHAGTLVFEDDTLNVYVYKGAGDKLDYANYILIHKAYLDAAEVNSGIFLPQLLGDGAPDNTTIIYGDQLWKTPKAGELYLFEHFNHFVTAGQNAAIEAVLNSGTGAAVSSVQSSTPMGVLQQSTGTTATGSQLLRFVNNNGFMNKASTKVIKFKVRIPTLSTGTETFLWRGGFSNTIASSDGAQSVGFRYTHSENGGKFLCVSRQNNTESTTDSGVTVVANQWYEMEVHLNTTQAMFIIDNVAVAIITTNLPTDGGSQYFGYVFQIVKSVGTTARTVQYDYYHVKIPTY